MPEILTTRQAYWRASAASEGKRIAIVLTDSKRGYLVQRRMFTDADIPSLVAIFFDDHLAWSRNPSHKVQNVFGTEGLSLSRIQAELTKGNE